MFRAVIIQKVLLIVVFTFTSGCGFKGPIGETGHVEQTAPSSEFQTKNYLTASENEKFVAAIVPEEQLAAMRILTRMVEFMAEGHCTPNEILVRVDNVTVSPVHERSAFTAVDLWVPDKYHSFGISLRLFTIREKRIRTLNFCVEKYLCTTGCCYDTLCLKEYPRELWEDIGTFSALEELSFENERLNKEKITERVRNNQR